MTLSQDGDKLPVGEAVLDMTIETPKNKYVYNESPHDMKDIMNQLSYIESWEPVSDIESTVGRDSE